MTNYVLLYTGGMGMESTPEEQQQIMAEWGAWYEKMGAAIVDGGNPFSPDVRSYDETGALRHGAVGVPATGYTIISADSLDAASEMCREHPHTRHGGQVSIYETFQVG